MSFELQCEIRHETDNAILIVDTATGEELWIPLSQIEEIHREGKVKGADRVVMTDWIAQKKGLL